MIRSILVLFLLSVSLPAFAQLFPHLVFQQFYDNIGDDYPRKLLLATDGNLLIGGNTILTDTAGVNCSNIWIIKTDTTGEMLWEQEITMSGCEELRDMVVSDDGGVIFTGVTNSLIPHKEKGDEDYWGDYFIGKVDSLGSVEWLQSYGGSDLDQANSIVKGFYREFLIAGGSHSTDGDVGKNFGMSDIWALKIDTRGQTRYSKVVGGINSEWANAMALCQDGDYLLAGYGNSPDETHKVQGLYGNGFLVRLAQSGPIVWQKTFPCPLGGYFQAVKEVDLGSIVVAGTRHTREGGKDFWYLRLNNTGSLISEHIIPGPENEVIESLTVCDDRGFLMGGYSTFRTGTGPYIKGGDDFWLLRTFPSGNIMWRNTYGGAMNERCRDVLEYRPGVFYAIGEKQNMFTRNNHTGDNDFWLLRVEEYPADSINASIFVRAEDYRITRLVPTRFRARHKYGDRFLWDFGDGTTSTEENPLKTYEISGLYEVTLTVFANESCEQTVKMEKYLEVW
ncbi:MAG: PKD domain-containing protein [Bacteroidia bacterium]|nr:PKD domain-containing protein [Bacteroidia bacterium]